jgi:hypothetical protein
MTPVSGGVLDHIVVAAERLAQGCDYVESALGVRPQPGGRHVAMGTHNAVLRLGERLYLEVIAIDPGAPAPPRPRWFDLDEPRMRATLTEGPRLVHYVARTGDIERLARQSPIDLGEIMPMARGDYRWRLTVPPDGHLPGRGLVPTLIEWSGAHPAQALPEHGLALVALAGEHPEPAPIRAAIARLGLADDVKVTYGTSPRLAAMIRTRRGVVTL